jgi:glucose-1-phosphate thymidylyltransferase
MVKIKTVIAAGGLGKRLIGYKGNDKTKVLLEVNGTPMINQQIKQLSSWGLSDFIIITNPTYDRLIRDVTSELGSTITLNFEVQNKPLGISNALSKANPQIKGDEVIILMLGDNFFGNNPLKKVDFEKIYNYGGCHIFSTKVPNPSEFGIAEIDFENNVLSIVEKPVDPKSNNAVVGLYIFDKNALNNISKLKPSLRGEYEITDLIDIYINQNLCTHSSIESWWIDAGTPERVEELEEKLSDNF